MASVMGRTGTSLRAGGACVRCRKGKTKCVYENGRPPCKNCSKGLHECYLPSESLAHHHGQSPARVTRPARESLPGDRSTSNAGERQQAATQSHGSRPAQSNSEKLTPDLVLECERAIQKTLPPCVAFHRPSFLTKLKSGTLDPSLVNALLTLAARSSPLLIRRYGGQGGSGAAAEHFAVKAISLIMQNLDNPSLGDIQALCLLIIHEWGSRQAVRAYVYLGQAARMAQMYRIIAQHQNLNEGDQFIRDESFRRTLWLIYILDCFLTSSPGRFPALSAVDIKDVALPCQDTHFNFGTPVAVPTVTGTRPRGAELTTHLTEVGEFGHIVMATKAWRNVVEMLTSVTIETFSEERCHALDLEIESVRQGLPMHFVDKANHIDLHITMGSGLPYAMLHILLHSATIMVNRRRLLQVVTAEGFNSDTWRNIPPSYIGTVDRVFSAAHSIVSIMLALERNNEKDSPICFPIVMLFGCFTASSTVAWFSLKGLMPSNVDETTEQLVRDGMRFLAEGAEAWTLGVPWYRHLSVMEKVLRNGHPANRNQPKPEPPVVPVKDETASQPDNNSDAMDYERPTSHPQEQVEGREISEPPRRVGFTTINGGSAGASTPATASPPPAVHPAKAESPNPPSSAGGAQPSDAPAPQPGSDMTAAELCSAFERQLLELDDLAAFMGGGY